MQVQLESTGKLVDLIVDGVAFPARIWEGVTAAGIPCHAYVTRIAVANAEDTAEFERDLLTCRAPSPALVAIPLRMIL
jgi:hypothetical protein